MTTIRALALPTIAGLYVAQDDTPDHAATVYRLDGHGFWSRLGQIDVTADEVAAHVGSHPLERLIRNHETDM